MKEFFNSLLEASKERIKNPFIGSFVFAWIIFNWKPLIYLLFSGDSIVDKISSIETKYVNWNDNLLIPLGIAIFYIVVLPYLMWGLEELYTRAKTERLSNKKDEELINISNRLETTKASLELENVKADYRDKSELNIKIKTLESDNKEKRETILENEKEILTLKNTFDEANKEIQNNISDNKKLNNLLNNRQRSIEEKDKAYNKIIIDKQTELDRISNSLNLATETIELLQNEMITNDDENLYDLEYDSFKASKLYDHFNEITLLISNIIKLNHSKFLLSFVEIAVDKGLLTKNKNNDYEFTKKGKYFSNKKMKDKLITEYKKKKLLL